MCARRAPIANGCSGTSSTTTTASYLVIPNLYAAIRANEEEAARALAMNQLAGVLSDLELVRWPNAKEG